MIGIYRIAFIVGSVSASAVIKCLDRNTCNRLRVIIQDPRDFGEVSRQYPNARELDVHGNLLDGYQPQSTAQWKKMNLSYNLLEKDVFRNIRNSYLEVVDLTYNRLTTVSIPSSVVEFIAERNQLYHMTFERQNNLQRLVAPKNKFDSLRIFAHLPKLQELDLSCNDISVLNVDEIPASLRTLKLSRNHIYSIYGSKALRSLEYLDLSHNILTAFSDPSIIFPKLRKLYLQGNKIVMWLLGESKKSYEFQEINVHDNDWHCNNLNKFIEKTRGLVSQVACRDATFADRLIAYRKKEFKALEAGTNQRNFANHSCSEYEPNPCDGDDDLVYSVAASAARDAKTLAQSSVQELQQTLEMEKTILNKLKENVTSFEVENGHLNSQHANLVAYIGSQYSEALKVQISETKNINEIAKLEGLFSYFEKENDNLKQQINEEQRNHQDKIADINKLEKEIEDLNYQKDKLADDVATRNATVNGYKAKIAALQAKLG